MENGGAEFGGPEMVVPLVQNLREGISEICGFVDLRIVTLLPGGGAGKRVHIFLDIFQDTVHKSTNFVYLCICGILGVLQ